MNDDELIQRMRTSRPAISFNADFSREIWGRIEAEERLGFFATFSGPWRSLLGWIARPVPAVALTVTMGVVGCLLATSNKRPQGQPAEFAYIKSVSPFAAAKIPHP